jgi:hypothetical protein
MRKRRKVPRGKRVAALNGLGRGRGGSPDAISDMTPRQTRHPERQSVKSPGNGNGIDEQAAFNDTAPGRHRCTQGSARIGSVAKQTGFPVYQPQGGSRTLQGSQNPERIPERKEGMVISPRSRGRNAGRLCTPTRVRLGVSSVTVGREGRGLAKQRATGRFVCLPEAKDATTSLECVRSPRAQGCRIITLP